MFGTGLKLSGMEMENVMGMEMENVMGMGMGMEMGWGWMLENVHLWLLDCRYKKNLKNLYIVHPTVFVKMVTWFTRPFVKKQFKSKIRHVSRLSSLFKTFDCKQLKVPHEVLQVGTMTVEMMVLEMEMAVSDNFVCVCVCMYVYVCVCVISAARSEGQPKYLRRVARIHLSYMCILCIYHTTH